MSAKNKAIAVGFAGMLLSPVSWWSTEAIAKEVAILVPFLGGHLNVSGFIPILLLLAATGTIAFILTRTGGARRAVRYSAQAVVVAFLPWGWFCSCSLSQYLAELALLPS